MDVLGSIMALNAIIVEYRLNNVQLKRFNRKSKQATFSGFPTNALPTKENQNIGKIAHVFIISGTIIWGYGDLINELIK